MDNKRIDEALMACEKVINGIEESTLSTSAALLLCKRIARLTDDSENILWLNYETNGYPRGKDNYIEASAFDIAFERGRGYYDKGNKNIFVALAPELEDQISTNHMALANFKMDGISVSGDFASSAMNRYVTTVTGNMATIIRESAMAQKRLDILKAQYYDYALKKQIELKFSNVAQSIFEKYRATVEGLFINLSPDILMKLQALEGKLDSNNRELYAEAATTCRRLFSCVSDALFDKYFPDSPEKYMTRAKKEIDVSGDHSLNKLSAVIETLENKSINKSIVGSSVKYLLDWMDHISKSQSKGVHAEMTKQEAERCIISTYIVLGDILGLQE